MVYFSIFLSSFVMPFFSRYLTMLSSEVLESEDLHQMLLYEILFKNRIRRSVEGIPFVPIRSYGWCIVSPSFPSVPCEVLSRILKDCFLSAIIFVL